MASNSTPIWLVNGASSGFGKAIAAEALQRNHRVIATARKTTSLAELDKVGASILSLDVTWDDTTIATKVHEASAIYGGITHLVNCAGYMMEGMIEEMSSQEVFDQFNTNVFGTLRVIRAALPDIRETNSIYPKVIANFGSMGSWTGWPSSGNYNGTKWAISGLTEALTSELAPQGIKAVVIEPGMFRTDFLSPDSNRCKSAKNRLRAYQELRAAVKGVIDSSHNVQPGDVAKGARVIVDVLTSSGVAEGRDIPLRLLLGSDSIGTVGQKCKDTLKLMDEWSDVIQLTDYDKA